MRDPNRIYKFCNVLAAVWAEEVPDMRFGQVVEVVFDKIRKSGFDPFYIEEDEMINWIHRTLDDREVF